MEPSPSWKIPESLKTQLKKQAVIPFVGAGLSMSIKSKETRKPLFPSL